MPNTEREAAKHDFVAAKSGGDKVRVKSDGMDSRKKDLGGKIVRRGRAEPLPVKGNVTKKAAVRIGTSGGQTEAVVRSTQSDPASRRKLAEKALEGHPRKNEILSGIDFRNPKESELAIAESLKGRARRAVGHGSAA